MNKVQVISSSVENSDEFSTLEENSDATNNHVAVDMHHISNGAKGSSTKDYVNACSPTLSRCVQLNQTNNPTSPPNGGEIWCLCAFIGCIILIITILVVIFFIDK